MNRRLELFTLGLTVSGLVFFSCSNGTGLTTGSAGNKETSGKKNTSADASKNTAGESGSENKRPVQAETSTDQSDDDSDLSVIPPEVVSAAYLTCTVNQTETFPDIEHVHLGCTITKENGEAFPKNTAHQKWGLKDSSGADVDYTEIALPFESSFHQIYGLQKSVYAAGVDPVVDIETSDLSVVPVKKKGVVRIDGKISE